MPLNVKGGKNELKQFFSKAVALRQARDHKDDILVATTTAGGGYVYGYQPKEVIYNQLRSNKKSVFHNRSRDPSEDCLDMVIDIDHCENEDIVLEMTKRFVHVVDSVTKEASVGHVCRTSTDSVSETSGYHVHVYNKMKFESRFEMLLAIIMAMGESVDLPSAVDLFVKDGQLRLDLQIYSNCQLRVCGSTKRDAKGELHKKQLILSIQSNGQRMVVERYAADYVVPYEKWCETLSFSGCTSAYEQAEKISMREFYSMQVCSGSMDKVDKVIESYSKYPEIQHALRKLKSKGVQHKIQLASHGVQIARPFKRPASGTIDEVRCGKVRKAVCARTYSPFHPDDIINYHRFVSRSLTIQLQKYMRSLVEASSECAKIPQSQLESLEVFERFKHLDKQGLALELKNPIRIKYLGCRNRMNQQEVARDMFQPFQDQIRIQTTCRMCPLAKTGMHKSNSISVVLPTSRTGASAKFVCFSKNCLSCTNEMPTLKMPLEFAMQNLHLQHTLRIKNSVTVHHKYSL